MSFLLRAGAVIALIAFLSPYRGDAERETARLAAEAPAHALAALPQPERDRLLAEGAAALARGAETALRAALVEPPPRPAR